MKTLPVQNSTARRMPLLRAVTALCALLFTVLAVPFTAAKAAAETAAEDARQAAFAYTGFDIDAFFEDIAVNYQNRSAKADAETVDKVTARIAEAFLDLDYLSQGGGAADEVTDYYAPFTVDSGTTAYASRNIVALKPADAALSAENGGYTVVVGAHYDNVYDYDVSSPYSSLTSLTLSHGAYDNASGLAVMMSAAHNLKDTPLPFNVLFAAFGAEEMGMLGSKAFLSRLQQPEKNKILLMVNLDSLCAGDYLYLFSADQKTAHETFLRGIADGLDVPLRALPREKKFTRDPFGLGVYAHMGYYSDNYYFMKEGIPTAFFMTMNWESRVKSGVVESDRHDDIMHTSSDTYATVKALYPDTYLAYMQYASAAVTAALAAPGFTEAMLSGRADLEKGAFLSDARYLTVAAFVVWLLFAGGAVAYYIHLKNRSAQKVKEVMEAAPARPVIPPFNPAEGKHTYPPRSYKPKTGEKEFSVFGEDFDQPKPDQTEKESGGTHQDNGKPPPDKYEGL